MYAKTDITLTFSPFHSFAISLHLHQTSQMHPDNVISIIHASEHNLRSVNVEIPKNSLTVVTGVSGSGKSSLIFDVLYREAESRYLGSFSSFARQFMGKMKKPDVEKVEGLSPAIALSQKSVVSSSRSTAGTITGIYDALRLLFARTGQSPSELSTPPKVHVLPAKDSV